MLVMQKNWGVTDFVFEIRRVENYPNFDTSVLVTRHAEMASVLVSWKIFKMIRCRPTFLVKFYLSGSVKQIIWTGVILLVKLNL